MRLIYLGIMIIGLIYNTTTYASLSQFDDDSSNLLQNPAEKTSVTKREYAFVGYGCVPAYTLDDINPINFEQCRGHITGVFRDVMVEQLNQSMTQRFYKIRIAMMILFKNGYKQQVYEGKTTPKAGETFFLTNVLDARNALALAYHPENVTMIYDANMFENALRQTFRVYPGVNGAHITPVRVAPQLDLIGQDVPFYCDGLKELGTLVRWAPIYLASIDGINPDASPFKLNFSKSSSTAYGIFEKAKVTYNKATQAYDLSLQLVNFPPEGITYQVYKASNVDLRKDTSIVFGGARSSIVFDYNSDVAGSLAKEEDFERALSSYLNIGPGLIGASLLMYAVRDSLNQPCIDEILSDKNTPKGRYTLCYDPKTREMTIASDLYKITQIIAEQGQQIVPFDITLKGCGEIKVALNQNFCLSTAIKGRLFDVVSDVEVRGI